ncbi:MAG: isopeptide-forming domain-containing fimbrial protein, partial [Pseudomonadota bacterium]
APVLATSYVDANGDAQSFAGDIVQVDGDAPLADGAALAFTVASNDRDIRINIDAATAAASSGTADQTFAIVYKAIVTDERNAGGNPVRDRGDNVSNRADLTTDTTDRIRVRDNVRIMEPELSIEKQFGPNGQDDFVEGGVDSTIDLTITVENANRSRTSPAYGLTFTDENLSKDFFSAVNSVTLRAGNNQPDLQARIDAGEITVQVVDNVAENRFELVVASDDTFFIDRNEDLILEAELQINPDLPAGSVLDNTVTIPEGGFSSLPGTPEVEREYGELAASDELFAIGPEITKTVISTSLFADDDPNVAVGELVTYQVDLDLPRGTVADLVIIDDFDTTGDPALEGMLELLSIDSVTVGADLALADFAGGLATTDFTLLDDNGDGRDDGFSIDIGNVANTAGAGAGDETQRIRIEFTARVMNDAAVRDGVVHANQAQADFTVIDGGANAPRSLTDDAEITIREPDVGVEKSSNAPAAGVDAGDEVTYTLQIGPRGAGGDVVGAFDLFVEDTLPEGMALVGGSVIVSGGDANAAFYKTLSADDVQIVTGPGGETIIRVDGGGAGDGFDLAPGDSATITYRATVLADAQVGDDFENEARLTYASLPSLDPISGLDPALPASGTPADAQRRDGSGVDFDAFDETDHPRDDASIADNYGDAAVELVEVLTPGPIVKTADAAEYVVGDLIAYRIDVPLIEGVTAGGVFTDVLPAGQAFELTGATVADSLTAVDGDGNALTILDARVDTVGGLDTLVIEFDDITLPDDNAAANDVIRIATVREDKFCLLLCIGRCEQLGVYG